MQITAKLRHLRIAPRKVRLVADSIRGLDVLAVQKSLQFTNKKAARPILKLLNSAIANAENNFKLKKDNLYISELRVDQGPVLKRWQPRAFGRASSIHKKTSHILIVLDEKVRSDANDANKHTNDTNKKIDKDVKIVKSLDEVKELNKKEKKISTDKSKPKEEEFQKEIKDIRMEGSDRGKQHLDTIRKKDKAGALKRMFRRKSI